MFLMSLGFRWPEIYCKSKNRSRIKNVKPKLPCAIQRPRAGKDLGKRHEVSPKWIRRWHYR